MLKRPALAALLMLVGLGVTGCERHEAPRPVNLTWQRVLLPAHGTARVAGLTACDGRWYAVGADGDAPAGWTSADGRAWSRVQLRPTTPYGDRGGFTSVSCRGRDVVAIHSASGGVHANPRVSTWRSAVTGGWDEIVAPFELFGGPNAGSVDQVVAGPAGWLIIGHRLSPTTGRHGAAVWTSTDGRSFRLFDDDPALRSTEHALTTAYDAAPVGNGWVLVGSSGGPTSPKPAAWLSTDEAHWRRTGVESSGTGAVERVLPFHRGGLIAVGSMEGRAFYSWLPQAPDGGSLDMLGVACGGVPEPAGRAVAGLAAVATAGGGSTLLVAVESQVGAGFWVTDLATANP